MKTILTREEYARLLEVLKQAGLSPKNTDVLALNVLDALELTVYEDHPRKSGDYCRGITGGFVEHWRCDDWHDGTTTDLEGKVIKAAPSDAQIGFTR